MTGYALASPPFCLSNSSNLLCDDECATWSRPNNRQIIEALGERRQFQAIAGAVNPGLRGCACPHRVAHFVCSAASIGTAKVEAGDAETRRPWPAAPRIMRR